MDNTPVDALAYTQGWNAAFTGAQELLSDLIRRTDGNQRFALIMASELLCHLASGRKLVLDELL